MIRNVILLILFVSSAARATDLPTCALVVQMRGLVDPKQVRLVNSAPVAIALKSGESDIGPPGTPRGDALGFVEHFALSSYAGGKYFGNPNPEFSGLVTRKVHEAAVASTVGQWILNGKESLRAARLANFSRQTGFTYVAERGIWNRDESRRLPLANPPNAANWIRQMHFEAGLETYLLAVLAKRHAATYRGKVLLALRVPENVGYVVNLVTQLSYEIQFAAEGQVTFVGFNFPPEEEFKSRMTVSALVPSEEAGPIAGAIDDYAAELARYVESEQPGNRRINPSPSPEPKIPTPPPPAQAETLVGLGHLFADLMGGLAPGLTDPDLVARLTQSAPAKPAAASGALVLPRSALAPVGGPPVVATSLRIATFDPLKPAPLTQVVPPAAAPLTVIPTPPLIPTPEPQLETLIARLTEDYDGIVSANIIGRWVTDLRTWAAANTYPNPRDLEQVTLAVRIVSEYRALVPEPIREAAMQPGVHQDGIRKIFQTKIERLVGNLINHTRLDYSAFEIPPTVFRVNIEIKLMDNGRGPGQIIHNGVLAPQPVAALPPVTLPTTSNPPTVSQMGTRQVYSLRIYFSGATGGTDNIGNGLDVIVDESQGAPFAEVAGITLGPATNADPEAWFLADYVVVPQLNNLRMRLMVARVHNAGIRVWTGPEEYVHHGRKGRVLMASYGF